MRALLVLAATLLALGAVGCGSGEEATTTPPDIEGTPAPEIAGVTADGERLALADFRGKPVFVNVWASW